MASLRFGEERSPSEFVGRSLQEFSCSWGEEMELGSGEDGIRVGGEGDDDDDDDGGEGAPGKEFSGDDDRSVGAESGVEPSAFSDRDWDWRSGGGASKISASPSAELGTRLDHGEELLFSRLKEIGLEMSRGEGEKASGP